MLAAPEQVMEEKMRYGCSTFGRITGAMLAMSIPVWALEVTPTPEPSMLALGAIGLAAMMLVARKVRRK